MIQQLYNFKVWATAKIHKFLYDEKGEVNIVAIVILIGIAVALAVIFRNQIMDLIRTILNSIRGTANNVVNPPETVA